MAFLIARGLRKRFGAITAVDGVSFEVKRGEMLALLGPNGAGKTTTIAMACGLLTPDAGEIAIDGRAFTAADRESRRRLGLVPQELALFEELTALENLRLFGALQGLSGRDLASTISANLELVGLASRANDRAGTYSGGMKRRLNLAAALLHDPDLILLDEPTAGVDPQSRNAIFENLEHLKKRGKSMIYTTHYMEEAERLCDRVVIIDHGKVLAHGTREELRRTAGAANVLTVDLEAEPAAGAIEGIPGAEWIETRGRQLRVGLPDLGGAGAILETLSARGLRYDHFASERASLETVFLTLTGRSLRD